MAFLYNGITGIRNLLYDAKWLKVHKFSFPVIVVGNLRVGGTGKTPFVDYLINHLVQDNKVAVLSRGYGRNTRGFVKADKNSTATTIGDEPLQYYLKYQDKIGVYVDEKRPDGILKIMESTAPDVIILDDAYQHRPLKSSLNILLTEYNRPFYNDFLIPSGRLRESRAGAARADIAVVTKCPDNLSEKEMYLFKEKIRQYAGKKTSIFFTRIYYAQPFCFLNPCQNIPQRFVLVCGIDNPDPFVQYCKHKFQISATFVYKDHHRFSGKDVKNIKESGLPVITTQKDMTRLLFWKKEFTSTSLYYLPITISFVYDEEVFLAEVSRKISAL